MGGQMALKRLLINVLPAALCGVAPVVARAEVSQWTDADRSQPPVVQAMPGQAQTWPPAPAPPQPDYSTMYIDGMRG